MKLKFPYNLRGNQKETIESIEATIGNRNHIVLESPTGSGKTFISLAATLPFVISKGLKIVYCVRTNSQQKQVIHELEQFKKAGNSIKAVAIQGRDSLCPQQNYDNELKKSNWSEKSKICKSLKIQSKMGEGGCQFYRRFLRDSKSLIDEWSTEILTAQDFSKKAEEAGLCPYELNKLLLKEAQVVIVPYVYFFEEFVRNYVLGWMGTSIDKIITIIDEAHNLPDWARNAASDSLSLKSINSAVNEVKDFGYLLPEGRDPIQFLNFVEASIEKLAEEHILENEDEGHLPSHIVSPDSEVPTFETEMMSLGKMTLFKLKQDSTEISKMGQMTRQYLLDHGKRPRSYLGSVGDFLCRWLDSLETHTIRLVGKDPLRLEKVCLDPRVMTGFLDNTAGVVSMSGTLSPLDMFRDLVGLRPDSILERKESVFPKNNKKVLYLPDVTTSYSELNSKSSTWDKIISKLELITSNFGGNIALFFPSYKLLELALQSINIKKPIYREYSGMGQEELMQTVESFKSDSSAVLAGVMGGRLAEGIDYPNTTLEMAIIVGIPYPAPGVRQNALQHYYDISFKGQGWKFAVESPAARKLLQAAGRVVRSETDRGFIVIADSRTGRFLEYIPELEQSNDIVSEINEFFEA
ncbi:MAG TPA: ATP-dependent DNA helicase [Candidatus Poseidoniia archaeon]|nr:ATP-dependent DNA helicase [Candidatus Poseidoniia archaeon]